LVDIVEDWEDLETYARNLPKQMRMGASYLLKKTKYGVELKVRVGRYGFARTFKEAEDAELIKILAFCSVESFIKVSGAVIDDVFFA
jgi:hypothetical protein